MSMCQVLTCGCQTLLIQNLVESCGLDYQVVQGAPQMFQLSAEDTLQPRLAFLREHLGVSAEGLAKILVKCVTTLHASRS